MIPAEIGSAGALIDVRASFGGLAILVGPGPLSDRIVRTAGLFSDGKTGRRAAMGAAKRLLEQLGTVLRTTGDEEQGLLARAAISQTSARLARLAAELGREAARIAREERRAHTAQLYKRTRGHVMPVAGSRVLEQAERRQWPVPPPKTWPERDAWPKGAFQ